MRIGIDGYPLTKRTKAGISRYTYHMIKSLLKIDRKNEYFLYLPEGQRPELAYPNLRLVSIAAGNLINKSSTLWMLFNAKRSLLKDRIDIFWATEGIIPPGVAGSIATLLTVHDLTFYLYPKSMALTNYLVNRFFLKSSIIDAEKIIAVSCSTANDIQRIFKKQALGAKIAVIYNGYAAFETADRMPAKKDILQRFNITGEFILYTGTIEPRKNIPGLLEAFKILKTKYNIRHKLVLAGPWGWKTAAIFKVCRKLNFKEGEVKFLGAVEEADLARLYCAADLFVMPSFYEGFGMPALEAMGCGLAVIASDIPIFKEILNNAALLVDTHKPEDLADAMRNVLTDKQLSMDLEEKGRQRCKLFSWEKAAGQMLNVFAEFKKI